MGKRHWSDPEHAMWKPITAVVYGVIVFSCLKVTATDFDASEWQAMGGIFAGIGGFAGVKHLITHWKDIRGYIHEEGVDDGTV